MLSRKVTVRRLYRQPTSFFHIPLVDRNTKYWFKKNQEDMELVPSSEHVCIYFFSLSCSEESVPKIFKNIFQSSCINVETNTSSIVVVILFSHERKVIYLFLYRCFMFSHLSVPKVNYVFFSTPLC